ncbi:hypothetical protein O6P43_003655 [Quillaja saponaria]|uniref:Uncharacterized protein n=1 Tax=Quillaja saponaria TaxID=32244 RepID=A0AAD7QF82_QUISA|nr:hypothetical protein O6P43_003655 [Quillaja saponaria]
MNTKFVGHSKTKKAIPLHTTMAGRIARLRELLKQLEEQEAQETQRQYRPPPPPPTYNHGGYFHNNGTQNLNG